MEAPSTAAGGECPCAQKMLAGSVLPADLVCPRECPCPWRDNKPETPSEVWLEFAAKSAYFLEKSRRSAGKRGRSEYDPIFDTLAGITERLPCCQASDVRARAKAAHLLHEHYTRILQARPLTHFWHVTILDESWHTSDEVTVLLLTSMLAAIKPCLESLTGNYVAVAELQPFANVKHPSGGKLLTLHSHSVVWGEASFDVDQALMDWKPRFQAVSSKIPSIQIDPVGPGILNLARVARYPLKAPCRCKTRYIHPETGKENLHESEKGDRWIRYHRMFEVLSQINLRDMFDAGGEGAPILEGIGQEMRSWANEQQGNPSICVHEIPEFWRVQRGMKESWGRFRPVIVD